MVIIYYSVCNWPWDAPPCDRITYPPLPTTTEEPPPPATTELEPPPVRCVTEPPTSTTEGSGAA